MREVTLQVESSVNAPRLSRSHLVDMKQSLGPQYDDVLLLVSELVSNSVRHSRSQDIGVKVLRNDDQIRVEVTDEGPGFLREAPRGDGMGLLIVDSLCERWGMNTLNDQFTVWAELSAG